MKKVLLLSLLALIGLTGTILLGQQDLELYGRFSDLKLLPKNNTKLSSQFVFTRLIYNGRILGYYKNWYTDFVPNQGQVADVDLIKMLKRQTNIDVADEERLIPVNDPNLFQYPFVYSSEEGQMMLSDEDAANLREYLLRGGFWVLDDFWGSFEWASMEHEMKKVFPDREIKDIPLDDPLFHVTYNISALIQVPSLAYLYNGGITWETDGFVPECKGIRDDKGRLMVVINHNSDLGDGYKWLDEPRYPPHFSEFAYHMALNFVTYSLTH